MDQDLMETSPKRVRGDPSPPPDNPAVRGDPSPPPDNPAINLNNAEHVALEGIETISSEAHVIETLTILMQQNSVEAGIFNSPLSYQRSCALVGCYLTRKQSHYCCTDHEDLSSIWSSKTTPFYVYHGLNESKSQRDEVCCSSIILQAHNQTGVPTLETGKVFTKLPWENDDVFRTALQDQEKSRDFLFFTTPPQKYTALEDTALGVNLIWKANGRRERSINGHEIAVTILNLNRVKGKKFEGWKLHLYQYGDLSLYCLSMDVQGVPKLKLPPKALNPKRTKPDEDPDGGDGKGMGEDSPSGFVNPNSKSGKTKQPLTMRQGTGKDTVVCGSTLDYGFHADDSQVTLNVSLSKESVGREVYFQYHKHGNTEPKSEVAAFAPSRPSHYANITLKNIFEPLHKELCTFDPTFFCTPSLLKAINGDIVESFTSGVWVSEMLQPGFCEMMLSKVENFGEWFNMTKIQIMRPNTMSKYSIVLDDFGLDSMLDNIIEGFVFPVSKGNAI